MALAKGGIGAGITVAGMFSGIKDAKIGNSGGEFIQPGRYWMRVDLSKLDNTRNKGPFGAVEMTGVKVLETVADAQGKVLSNRVGQAVQWFLLRSSDYWLSEIKEIVANTFNVPPEQVDEEACAFLFGPEQPLTHRVVEVRSFIKPARMKKDNTMGKDFNQRKFERQVPIPEVLAGLAPEVIESYFPNQILQRLHAADTAPLPATA